MKYNRLGHSGLYVSQICLGTMTFSGQGFFGGLIGAVDQKSASAFVVRALEAGVNFIDTADVYSEGQSEVLTGQAIRDAGIKRSDIVIATKACGRTGDGPNEVGASRGHLMDAVARSLDRLKTDHIDLYQIHANDPITPVEETMRALDDLVAQGMVRYIGCSNWPAWKVMKAQGIAAAWGWTRFETAQDYYSLVGREIEREGVPMLTDQQVGLLVWSPLAGGFLSGKFRRGSAPADARRSKFDFPPVDQEKAWPLIEAMDPIAKAHETTVAGVAIGWLLAKSHVTSVIVGAKTMAQLDDNLKAAKVELTPTEVALLDELSALTPEYPGWMIERQGSIRMPGAKAGFAPPPAPESAKR